mgnify:CR=1 FL=1
MSERSWQQQLELAVNHLKKHDPALEQVIAVHPLPSFEPHARYYQELIECIVSQQLSVKAADTILQRFKALFGVTFPTPEEILEKDIEMYRAVGLSRQKASYIRDLAEKVIDGTVHFEHLNTLTNQEIINELTKVKGVGVWTVHMFLMFCMGRLDVFPTGDLGIRNGIQALYDLAEKPTAEEMEGLAIKNNWHPYETIASWYIWRSLNNTPVVEKIVD